MEKKNYSIVGAQYAESQDIVVDKRCNGWAAVNQGNTPVFVNGILLQPNPAFATDTLAGESVSIDGNEFEFYTGRISIVFDDLPGTAPKVLIIQKFYI